MPSVQEAVEKVFKEEYGRVFASMVRIFGDFEVAEEAIQDSFATALDRWPRETAYPTSPPPGSPSPLSARPSIMLAVKLNERASTKSLSGRIRPVTKSLR